MPLLLNSWFVIRTEALPLLTILLCVGWGFVIVAQGLRPLLRSPSGDAVIFPLALAGWAVPALLFAAVLYSLRLILRLNPQLPPVLAVLVLAASWAAGRFRGQRGSSCLAFRAGIPFLIVLASLLLIRLGFVARVPLPLYFDSAEHYRIIRLLRDDYLRVPTPSSIAAPVQGYYHVGYHLIMAVLAAVSHGSISQLMLVSGAVVMAVLPLALFVIPFQETGSRLAGFLAVLLGEFGWYVPAYVLNWGKYPALFGLPVVLFAVDIAYLMRSLPQASRAKRVLGVWVLIAAGVATIIHTRSLILLAIAAVAWQLSKAWMSRSLLQRRLLLALSVAGLIGILALLSQAGSLAIVLDPYLYGGPGVTGLVGLLAIPAFMLYPQLSLACLLTIGFMCLGLMIPVPGFGATPLLDRPLVEMVLFAPLSILAATGFPSLMRLLRSTHPLMRAGVALACVAVVAQAAAGYDYVPSSCCDFAGADDVTALNWIEDHVPAGDSVLIAIAPTRDAPPPYPPLVGSSDAGVWILPLTGRPTAALPYWSDFSSADTRTTICGLGARHVYVGSARRSFSSLSLDERPEWYQVELALPASRVYSVSACTP